MKYIAWLDTNAGHIIVFIFLILVGFIVNWVNGNGLGKEIVTGSLGALLYSMKAGNKTPIPPEG
jgi:hypothetical protein